MLDLFGDAQETVEVAAVDVGGQPVFAGVGESDGVHTGTRDGCVSGRMTAVAEPPHTAVRTGGS
jgi:hypothetical protein